MPQAANGVDGFEAGIFEECRFIEGVGGTGIHEIVPDQDAVAVAGIEEGLVLVIPAAPDAQHVHVGLGAVMDPALVALGGQAGGEGVGGDPVGSFGKQWHAVDLKGEGFAPCIGVLAQ